MTKKFTIRKSYRNFVVFALICCFLLFVLSLIFLLPIVNEMFRYGWNGLSDNEKSEFVAFAFIFISPLISFQYFTNFLRRFVCVTDEKVYGNIGFGFADKPIEASYSEIISVIARGGGLTLETVKGTYVFSQMESPDEIVRLINSRMPLPEKMSSADTSK